MLNGRIQVVGICVILVKFFQFSHVFENFHHKMLGEIFKEIHVAMVDVCGENRAATHP